MILEDCARHGIEASALQQTSAASTSYTDVMTVRDTGRRTFFHARGANALLDSLHFDFTKTTARIFHLGYLLLLDKLDGPSETHGTVAAEVLARAQAAGLKTSIDVVSEDSDRFAKVVTPALQYVDVCIMNEFEAERVTRVRIRREDKIDQPALIEAMGWLLRAGVRERVVIHFPEGGALSATISCSTSRAASSFPAGYIKGAAGAGDAFTAGILYGWHEGMPVSEWLLHGVCAAAANLSDETCTRRDEEHRRIPGAGQTPWLPVVTRLSCPACRKSRL